MVAGKRRRQSLLARETCGAEYYIRSGYSRKGGVRAGLNLQNEVIDTPFAGSSVGPTCAHYPASTPMPDAVKMVSQATKGNVPASEIAKAIKKNLTLTGSLMDVAAALADRAADQSWRSPEQKKKDNLAKRRTKSRARSPARKASGLARIERQNEAAVELDAPLLAEGRSPLRTRFRSRNTVL